MDTSTLLALSLGLAAGIGWGISGFFDAKASKTVGPLAAALLVNCLIAILYAVMFCLFWLPATITASGVWYAVGGGVIITIGALAYFKALAIGPVSLASPMSSSYPLVTTLLALFVFGASLRGPQIVGIGLIIVGVMAATQLLRPRQLRALESRGPLLGLLAALCWGVGYTFVAQAVQRLGWQSATFFEFTAMALAFGICVPFANKGRFVPLTSITQGLRNNAVLLASGIAFCAALAFNIGLSHDTASGALVSALSACYPIITVLLALRHFDEQVAKLPLIGALASISGVLIVLTF